MFTNYERLRKKTPEGGIDRKEFIKHLVEEYYTTTDIEAQEQVTANLANFAYDPLNWPYLKEADTLQLFIELVSHPNRKLKLHSLTGLNNICLDTVCRQYLCIDKNISTIAQLLIESNDIELILQILGIFYQLLQNCIEANERKILLTPEVLKHFYVLKKNIQDQRILNLIEVILSDFATRKIELDLDIENLKTKHNETGLSIIEQEPTHRKISKRNDNN